MWGQFSSWYLLPTVWSDLKHHFFLLTLVKYFTFTFSISYFPVLIYFITLDVKTEFVFNPDKLEFYLSNFGRVCVAQGRNHGWHYRTIAPVWYWTVQDDTGLYQIVQLCHDCEKHQTHAFLQLMEEDVKLEHTW